VKKYCALSCMHGSVRPSPFSAEPGSHLLREELLDSPDRPAGDASSGLVRVRERAHHKKFCLFLAESSFSAIFSLLGLPGGEQQGGCLPWFGLFRLPHADNSISAGGGDARAVG
jgi:hypothetical protein